VKAEALVSALIIVMAAVEFAHRRRR